jgi:hypothetical protein
MLLEVAFAISLAISQDTCSIDSVSVFTAAHHVACAGDFKNWDEVLEFRDLANREGFGSNAMLKSDSSYNLSFVLFGDSSAVHTQLDRLNEILKLSLSAKQITFGDVRRQHKVAIENRQGQFLIIDSGRADEFILREMHPIISLPRADSSKVFAEVDSAFYENRLIDSINVQDQNVDFASPVQVDRDSIITITSSQSTIKDSLYVVNELEMVKPDEVELSFDNSPSGIIVSDSLANSQDSSGYLANNVNKSITDYEEINDPTPEAAPRVKEYYEGVEFQIVFGSYSDVSAAKEYLKKLQSEGFDAGIRAHRGFYRVGPTYSYYPDEELERYRSTHAPCWLVKLNIDGN